MAVILLIACGNSLRGDDGAGLILAQRLAVAWRAKGLSMRYLPVQQLVPELAPEIASPQVKQVLFLDCRQAANLTDTAVKIRRLEAVEGTASLGHHLSPELLLLYARRLFDDRPSDRQPIAWQITVPGFQFGHSETLSDICRSAVNEALQQITAWLDCEPAPDVVP